MFVAAACQTAASAAAQSILATPEVHSKLIQDGFRSRFFLNDTSGVDYTSLGSFMFAQIRTLSDSVSAMSS